jgi:hypothetical protein
MPHMYTRNRCVNDSLFINILLTGDGDPNILRL